MKLKKKGINNNLIPISQKKPSGHYIKNICMDTYLSITPNKSIYVNKVLKKSLGRQHPDSEISENMPNFQSNIRSILSNEENRERAIKYIVDMRRRIRTLSPSFSQSNYLLQYNNKYDLYNNRMNGYLSRTSNDGFYTTQVRKKKNRLDNLSQQEINDYSYNYNVNENYKRYKKNNNIYRLKNLKNNYNVITPCLAGNLSPKKGDSTMPENVIRVNKISKYVIKIPNLSKDRNLYEKTLMPRSNTSRLLQSGSYKSLINSNNIKVQRNTVNLPLNNRTFSRKELFEENYDNRYNDRNNRYGISHLNNNYYDSYNEEDEDDEHIYVNQHQDIQYLDDYEFADNSTLENNSLLKEVIIDNVNEINQTPEYEEYYSNIKIQNEPENNNNKIYFRNLEKRKEKKKERGQMIFNKKNKKMGKYNSFYRKKDNLGLSFNNLTVEKNRITIKMKSNTRTNSNSNNTKMSSNEIQNDRILSDNIKSSRISPKGRYNKLNEDFKDNDYIEMDKGNSTKNENDNKKEKYNNIKKEKEKENIPDKEKTDKKISERNSVNNIQVKSKNRPERKKTQKENNNKKPIQEINLMNNNKYNILKYEEENNKKEKEKENIIDSDKKEIKEKNKENIDETAKKDNNPINNKEKQKIAEKEKKLIYHKIKAGKDKNKDTLLRDVQGKDKNTFNEEIKKLNNELNKIKLENDNYKKELLKKILKKIKIKIKY